MSRLKSGREAKAKPAGGAPPRRSTSTARGKSPTTGRGVYVPSQKSDIYVALLGISLASILIGCLLLGLVMARYDFKRKAASLTPPASELSVSPHTVIV